LWFCFSIIEGAIGLQEDLEMTVEGDDEFQQPPPNKI
jgi:hypothetical protein